MKIPKVSILMPVFNAGKFLKKSIESILNQTFTDFEFLIFNDGSTDESAEVISSFDDERIVFVNKEKNSGYVKHLIEGVKIAKGEYIARIDADDISLPTRLEKQVRFLDKRKNIAVVGSYAIHIDSNGNLLCYRKLPVNSKSNLLYIIAGKNPLIHPGVMFRKKIVDRIGCYREEFMPSEDIDLWLRLYQNGYASENISEYLTKVRIHKMQISNTDNTRQSKKHILAFSNFYNSVTKKNIDNIDIEQYFNVLVWRTEKVKINNFFKILIIMLELYKNLIPPNKNRFNIFSKFHEIKIFQIFGLIYLLSRSNIHSIIISKILKR